MRLFPEFTRELENELVQAVEESNDGYPQHLEDMRGWYEQITDAHIDAIADELHVGQCEGMDCGRDD